MAIKKVSDSTFKNEVLEKKTPVLLYFSAEWCESCTLQAPILKEVDEKFAERVTFAEIDTDENPVTAREYAVKGIPTLLIFSGGELVGRQVGYIAKDKVEEFINEHVKK